MNPRTPTEIQSPIADPVGPRPGRVIKIAVPNRLVLPVLVGIVMFTFGGMFFFLEAAFARWAPWVSTEGMGGLVTIVWGHHMLPVIRRERPVWIGLVRASAIAALTAFGITGAFYLVRP